jgi:hypothetical protein
LEHFPDSHLSGICIVYFPDIFLTFSGHLFFIGWVTGHHWNMQNEKKNKT